MAHGEWKRVNENEGEAPSKQPSSTVHRVWMNEQTREVLVIDSSAQDEFELNLYNSWEDYRDGEFPTNSNPGGSEVYFYLEDAVSDAKWLMENEFGGKQNAVDSALGL